MRPSTKQIDLTSPFPKVNQRRKTVGFSQLSDHSFSRSSGDLKISNPKVSDDVPGKSSPRSIQGDTTEIGSMVLDPLIPLVEKEDSKVMPMLQKAGAALAFMIVAISVALGLVKFLIFLFGILFLLGVQVVALLRFIINENTREKERIDAEEAEKEEEIEAYGQEENPLESFHEVSSSSSNNSLVRTKYKKEKTRRMDSDPMRKGREETTNKKRKEDKNSRASDNIKEKDNQFLNFDQSVKRRSSSAHKKRETIANNVAVLKLETIEDVDAASDSPAKLPQEDKTPRVVQKERRKSIKRPEFLASTFDPPKIINFLMAEECKCRQTRSKEVRKQFDAAIDRVLDFMKYVKLFYQSAATCQEVAGNTLLTIGNPSRSFIGIMPSSPLFDLEDEIFTEEHSPKDKGDIFTKIKFFHIRDTYQKSAQALIDATTSMKQEIFQGELTSLQTKTYQLAGNFRTNYAQLSKELEMITKDLRKAENEYRSREDSLRDLIDEYTGHAKTKTYEEMVALESRCKLAQIKLDAQSDIVMEKYAQFKASIDLMESNKQTVIAQLRDIMTKKAPIFIQIVHQMCNLSKVVEEKTLKEFQNLLEPMKLEQKALEFIIEKSSESSFTEISRKGSGDMSDSDEGKVGNDESNRRKTILESPEHLICLQSELKSGGNLSGLDAMVVTEGTEESCDANSPRGGTPLDAMPQLNLLAQESEKQKKGHRKRPSQVLQYYETEKKATIQGDLSPVEKLMSDEESSRILLETGQTGDVSAMSLIPHTMPNQDISQAPSSPGKSPEKQSFSQLKESPRAIGLFQHQSQEKGMNEEKKEISGISYSGDRSSPQIVKNTPNAEDPILHLEVLDKVTKEDFLVAEQEYQKANEKNQNVIKAILELSKFFKDIAEVNLMYEFELSNAIKYQYKQIKSVGAGVPIELASDDGNNSRLKVVKKISESKKYGPSTQRLIIESDYSALIHLWEEYLEEQKQSTKVLLNNSEKLEEFGKKVDEQLSLAKDKVQEKMDKEENLSKQVKLSIEEINKLNVKLEYVQQNKEQSKLEQEELADIQEIASGPSGQGSGPKKSESSETQQTFAAKNGNAEPPVLGKTQSTPGPEIDIMTPKLGGFTQISSEHNLLRKQDTVQSKNSKKFFQERKKSNSVSSRGVRSMKSPLTVAMQESNQVSDGTQPAAQVVRTSGTRTKLKLKRQRSNSMEPLSFKDEVFKIQCQASTKEEIKEGNLPIDSKPADKSASGGGWFGGIGNLFSWGAKKEEELPDEQELITLLEAEHVKLDFQIADYIKVAKSLEDFYKIQQQEYLRFIVHWKKDIVMGQINKSKLCLDQFKANQKTEINIDDLAKKRITVVIKDFCDRKDGCITYHEPNCPNFYFFEEHSSPYNKQADDVFESSSSDSHGDGSDDSFASLIKFDDNQSAGSRASYRRKTSAGLRPSQDMSALIAANKVVTKETTFWLNNLLAVFHLAWKDAKVFQNIVCEAMYYSLNVDRSSSLGEIKCIGLGLEGKPPEIKWVRRAPNDNADDGKPHFAIDAEVIVPGKVKLMISTVYYLNSIIGQYDFPIKLEIIVSRISGSIRLQYSNDAAKGSFLQFLGRPAISVDIEPLAGDVSKVNLKSIPTVKGIIKGIVNKAIEDLCFPNLQKMSIPCVLESQQLDAKGKIIMPHKPSQKLRSRSKSLKVDVDIDQIMQVQKKMRKSRK